MHQVMADSPRACRSRIRVDLRTSSPRSPLLNAAASPLKIMASADTDLPDEMEHWLEKNENEAPDLPVAEGDSPVLA